MNAVLKKNHELFAAEPENTQAFDALVEHYYFNSDDWSELVSLYRVFLDSNQAGEQLDALQQVIGHDGQHDV